MGNTQITCIRHISKRQSINEIIGEIQPGYNRLILTGGFFDLMDYVEEIIRQVEPADVDMITWTMELDAITRIQRSKEGGLIKKLRICIEPGYGTRRPEHATKMVEWFGAENLRCMYSHAKIVTFKTKNLNLVLRTSMNFNKNIRIEQIDLTDSSDMMEFFTEIIDEMFQDKSNILKKVKLNRFGYAAKSIEVIPRKKKDSLGLNPLYKPLFKDDYGRRNKIRRNVHASFDRGNF